MECGCEDAPCCGCESVTVVSITDGPDGSVVERGPCTELPRWEVRWTERVTYRATVWAATAQEALEVEDLPERAKPVDCDGMEDVTVESLD